MNNTHKPVLYDEVLTYLDIKPAGIYVDGTFGRGGHTEGILSRLGSDGRLYAIDKDDAALRYAHDSIDDERFQIRQGSFSDIASIASDFDIVGKIDGVLLDLGVSSPQLDIAERGFSFLREGPLDMRMDTSQGMTAEQWINTASTVEIADVLKTFGEEKFARRIAYAIEKARLEKRITSTLALANIIAAANPAWETGKHPATRSFQAIRIFINQELADLEKFLAGILPLLRRGGRICIISFHSLEDRLVKRYFRQAAIGDDFPKNLPITQDKMRPTVKLIKKDIRPSDAECARNIRSRSAVMRVAEKI
jgi:16S rRNA (cytosine1402-N4)-methyltransferase